MQRLAQFVRVSGGLLLRLAEDMRCHFAHHACDQVAVTLQCREVEVTRLVQVHLAAVNHGLQVALFDLIGGGQRHQRLHDRVAGLARE